MFFYIIFVYVNVYVDKAGLELFVNVYVDTGLFKNKLFYFLIAIILPQFDFMITKSDKGDKAMQHWGIEYTLEGRYCFEAFAVHSKAVLALEIDAIKAKGGENIRLHYMN